MLHTCLRTTHDPQPFGHSTSLLSQWTRWSWGEDKFSSVNNRSQSFVLRCNELNQSQPVLYLGQLIMIDSSQILRFFTFQMSVVKLPMMYCIVLFWVVFLLDLVHSYWKGHSQIIRMRFRYHFLAVHATRRAWNSESEKRIRNTLNKPCRFELVTSRNRDRP